MANFVVPDIKEAILKTKAQVYYFMNLMTKKGQTHNLGAHEIVQELEKYLGKKINGIIINSDTISKSFISKYEKAEEEPILDDLKDDPRALRVPLLSRNFIFKDKNDSLSRSILKHDTQKTKKTILKIIK